MKLRRTTVLSGIENALRKKIIPLLADDFARNEVHLAASLIGIDCAGRDEEVALLVEEQDRIRALFAEAAGKVGDAALANRLSEMAKAKPDDLRMGALMEATARLRDLLVELHIYVESQDEQWASELDRAIWRLIRDNESARNPKP
ncbi:MAG: hypothetical protein KDE32_00555 [Novosphingobium sp.]|nr:hypothetical protein [Novosphingobium sp.]